MPYVTVKMLEGRTEEQKKALAEKVTAAVSETTGAPAFSTGLSIAELKERLDATGIELRAIVPAMETLSDHRISSLYAGDYLASKKKGSPEGERIAEAVKVARVLGLIPEMDSRTERLRQEARSAAEHAKTIPLDQKIRLGYRLTKAEYAGLTDEQRRIWIYARRQQEAKKKAEAEKTRKQSGGQPGSGSTRQQSQSRGR